MSSDYVASLTYEGANGKMIMRPPGLTDLAGGAAGAAVLTATLGLVLMTDATTKWWQRILCGVLTMVGFFVLYLTQIRSAMMGLIAVIFVVIGLRLLKKRFSAGIQLAGAVVILVALAFVWAVGIGGAQVSDRFFGIIDEGVAQSYKKNRGAFVADTFMDVLPKYPFGGAAGEWGIIGIYFYHTEDLDRPYAEIQITGWVYDGGLPLLVCYSGAILFALLGILKFAWKARTGQDEIVTQTILCVNLSLALGAFAGPTFNTQLGMLFWFLTAVLYQQVYWRQRRPAPSRNHWRSQPAALRGAQMHRHAPFGGLPHGAFQALL
jgi:O-antigen ligase